MDDGPSSKLKTIFNIIPRSYAHPKGYEGDILFCKGGGSLDQIIDLIENRKFKELRQILVDKQPADIAEVMGG